MDNNEQENPPESEEVPLSTSEVTENAEDVGISDEKAEKKEKLEEKIKEIEKKKEEIVEQNFLKVFDKKVRFHTILFILGAVLIGVLGSIFQSTGEEGAEAEVNIVVTISYVLIFGYLIYFGLSQVKSLHEKIFNENEIVVQA